MAADAEGKDVLVEFVGFEIDGGVVEICIVDEEESIFAEDAPVAIDEVVASGEGLEGKGEVAIVVFCAAGDIVFICKNSSAAEAGADVGAEVSGLAFEEKVHHENGRFEINFSFDAGNSGTEAAADVKAFAFEPACETQPFSADFILKLQNWIVRKWPCVTQLNTCAKPCFALFFDSRAADSPIAVLQRIGANPNANAVACFGRFPFHAHIGSAHDEGRIGFCRGRTRHIGCVGGGICHSRCRVSLVKRTRRKRLCVLSAGRNDSNK